MIKNRILYAALLFLSLIFIYFYGGKVPYTLFYTALLLPVFSFLHAYYIFRRFKFIQEVSDKFVTKGDIVKFTFRICNEDILLYPYVSVTFYGSDSIFRKQFTKRNFSLFPFKEKSFAFEVECKYRGTYSIGIESVYIMDLLGLLSLRYKVREPRLVTVAPKIVKLDRFNIKTNFISESKTLQSSKIEDMTTISDIRNYAYGDSFKRIHWKLTSKLSKLMVKNFQSTTETNAVIILDIKKNKYSFEENTILEDKVIESAIALINFCLENWISIRLIYFSSSLVTREAKNSLDFEDIYRFFSNLRFDDDVHVGDILDIYLKENLRQDNVFVITSNLDYELSDSLYKARLAGNETSLIYVSPYGLGGFSDAAEKNILNSFIESGINLYRINLDDDIKTVLER
ncbi:MAG TPA: DUF58 domain-containing protein [Clostridia bacterium]